MPPRPTRGSRRRYNDTVVFVVVLLLVTAGIGLLAAYEHGYFEETARQPRLGNQDVYDESEDGLSSDTSRPPETASDSQSHENQATDLLSQPTLLTEDEPNAAIYNSLSDSERESLQHIAAAVDTTLKGRRYREPLTDDDLKAAEKYSTLINPARWREFWYRTAARTAGFPRFQRLRDRGDEDDFKSAAVAWIQLDGFTRGIVLEALEAISEEDEELLDAHRETIEQYQFILGIDIPGKETPEQPLRAPRP